MTRMADTEYQRAMPAEVSGAEPTASEMNNPTPPTDVAEAAPPPEVPEGTGTMTAYSVAAVMATSALGAGLLNFPAAYNVAGGIITSSILQLVLVAALGGTVLCLALCSEVNNDRTYHDVLLSMCGVKWRYASAASVLLTCYGVCVSYLIVIGDQFDRIFASLQGPDFCHTWYMTRQFTISATALVIVLPLNLLQHIQFLHHVSTLGIVAVLYPCVLTCVVYFTEPRPKDLHVKVWPENAFDVLLSTPVFCFAYQSHEVVVTAYAAMRERSLWNMSKAIGYSMAILIVIYSMVGCFGYLSYGSAVRSDVMEMFDATKAWVLVGLVALILKMALTYPVPAICARDAIEEFYLEIRGLRTNDTAHRKARKITLSLVWFVTTVGVAVLPLDIGLAMKFLGCLAALNIFLFPGMCLIGYARQRGATAAPLNWRLLLGSIMVLTGGVIFTADLLHVVLVDLVSGHVDQLCS